MPDITTINPSKQLNMSDTTTWTTDGVKIYVSVNGGAKSQFYFRGVSYSPTPIGVTYDAPPFGDYWSNTPQTLWNKIWERDIPMFGTMGINSIKTYSIYKWEPGTKNVAQNSELDWTAGYTEGAKPIDEGWDPPSGNMGGWQHAEHKTFLDALYAAGVYIWVGIPVDNGHCFGDNKNESDRTNWREFTKKSFQWVCETYGEHPAIAGFVVGNEWNSFAPTNPSVSKGQMKSTYDFFDELQAIATQYAPTKLTMSALLQNYQFWTYAVLDDSDDTYPETGKTVNERYPFQVFGINPYSDILSGAPNNVIPQYKAQVVNNSDSTLVKPLVFTEWGTPGMDHEGTTISEFPATSSWQWDGADTNGQAIVDFLTSTGEYSLPGSGTQPYGQNVWHALTENLDCISGSFYFGWSDEWWKVAGASVFEQNAGTAVNVDFPGGFWDEEAWGLFSIDYSGRDPGTAWNDQYGWPSGNADALTARASACWLKKMFTTTVENGGVSDVYHEGS